MDSDLCNTRYLPKTPVCRMKVPDEQQNAYIYQQVKETLNNSLFILLNRTDLTTETFVIKQLIYKKKGQIRRQKVLQSLQQVVKCSQRFSECNLIDIIRDLLYCFEDGYFSTRQMMEYLLVRLMGTGILLSETSSYCQKAFVELQQRLETGHLVSQNLLFLASVSRLRGIVCALCLNVVSWYNNLMSCLNALPAADYVWLPEGLIFPTDLNDWIISNVSSPILVKQTSLKTKRASLLMNMVNRVTKREQTFKMFKKSGGIEDLETEETFGALIDRSDTNGQNWGNLKELPSSASEDRLPPGMKRRTKRSIVKDDSDIEDTWSPQHKLLLEPDKSVKKKRKKVTGDLVGNVTVRDDIFSDDTVMSQTLNEVSQVKRKKQDKSLVKSNPLSGSSVFRYKTLFTPEGKKLTKKQKKYQRIEKAVAAENTLENASVPVRKSGGTKNKRKSKKRKKHD